MKETNRKPFLKRLGKFLKAIWNYITYSKYKNYAPVNYLKAIQNAQYIKYEDVKDKLSYRTVKHINCNIADEEYFMQLEIFKLAVREDKTKLRKKIKEGFKELF